MGKIIGIDIGGSTTKIVGLADGELIKPLIVRADDPIASLFGAFGKFVDSYGLSLDDIDKIMVTGVGASFVTRPLYGLSTIKVPEFMANGLGGLYLSGLERAIIVSMGTGTALVKAGRGGSDKARGFGKSSAGGSAKNSPKTDMHFPCDVKYIGGTGIGGGTILGLANRMINIRDIDLIIKAAESGDLRNIDLMVGDITTDILPGLPPTTTASNFGKISDLASTGDIALGILNMVFQSIGTQTMFALRAADIQDAVLIGNLSAMPQCDAIFKQLSELYSINFYIPEYSEYGTAVGAALADEEAIEKS